MDFHFHVFLEWMYVHRAVEESDLHKGETDSHKGRAPHIRQNDTEIVMNYAQSLLT